MIDRLTSLEEAKAHFLWTKKKLDTLQIAEALGLGKDDEHHIWRSLYRRRENDRRMRAATKRMAAS